MLLSVTAICSFTFSCYRFKKCTQTNLKAIINHSLYTDQHKMKIFSSQPLDSNNISANRISGKELINHKWNLYKSMVKSKINLILKRARSPNNGQQRKMLSISNQEENKTTVGCGERANLWFFFPRFLVGHCSLKILNRKFQK